MVNEINSFDAMHIAVGHTGIKYNRNDLLLIHFDNEVNVAGVYTKSSITSPTVGWCRNITKTGSAKALIVNSGNANTMTGQHGITAINEIVKAYAAEINCRPEEILVNSTGVIGEPLPYHKIINALKPALANPATIEDAARAIMTTDLKVKIASKICQINGKDIKIAAFAKGSGMCAPNMATVLCYVVTDANIPADILDKLLKSSIDKSLNSVSVDSDCSTNDSTLLFATKTVKHDEINNYNSEILDDFKHTLDDVLIDIAKQIAADGEGATKLIQVNVKNTQSIADAKIIARSIAESPLVKTAIFGNDPNWGRIAMAIGKTNIDVDISKLTISLGVFDVFADNANKMDKELEQKLFDYLASNKEVEINVDLGFENNGHNSWSFYSCDLTNDYIKINTLYRT
jgi:glutamate N-acetyltransferase/amino-acid N-acetyltransferase